MKDLKSFIDFSNRGHFSTYMKKAHKHGLTDTSLECYSHKACHFIKKNLFSKDFDDSSILLQSYIELNKILPLIERKSEDLSEIYKNFICGRYDYDETDFTFKMEYLSENIKYCMSKKKIIFIILDILGYCVFPIKKRNTYIAHSVVVILIPNETDYNCYYINSHGHEMQTSNFYEFILSRRRAKYKRFDEPIDIKFMKSYINFINSDENITQKIHFENTKKHVYFGINMQAGDYHGICFIYPLIIWYNFGMFYNKARTYIKDLDIGKLNIKKGTELIEQGNLSFFVETMFLEFCPVFKNVFIDKNYELFNRDQAAIIFLQNIIAHRKILFTKVLLKSFVNFITQTCIKNFVEI